MGQIRVILWGTIVWNLFCLGSSTKQPPVVINILNSSDASSISHALTDTLNIQMLNAEQNNLNLAYEWLEKAQSWFGQYKKVLAGGSCILVWAVIYNRILTINHYLQGGCWSSWKGHISLERLSSVPQDELAKDLVLDVQQSYLNPTNPIDSLSPLIEFLKVVEEEKKMIQEYLFLHKWSQRFFITRFFPFIESEINSADKRIQRLVYVKKLFNSWAVNQNFASFSKHEKRMETLCVVGG